MADIFNFGNPLTQGITQVSIVSLNQVPLGTLDFGDPNLPWPRIMINFLRSGVKAIQFVKNYYSEGSRIDLEQLQDFVQVTAVGDEKFSVTTTISPQGKFVVYTVTREG